MTTSSLDEADRLPTTAGDGRPHPTLTTTRGRGGPWAYRALILTFARRDLRGQFKGTILGFAWSFALPLATLITYSIVFGLFFHQKAPSLGHGPDLQDGPFPLFLFCGLVPWNMYAITLSTAIATLLGTGPLMKKIYFPPYAAVFGSVLARFYLELFELGILLLALLAFVNVGPSWLLVLAWLPFFAAFIAACSVTLSVLNVHLRDVNYFVGIALQLQFYTTPIIFRLDQVPGSEYGIPFRTLVKYQPMSTYVQVFRSNLYGLGAGPLKVWIAMVVWTGLAVLIARTVYKRRGLDLSEEM